jgi:hypothetical protein
MDASGRNWVEKSPTFTSMPASAHVNDTELEEEEETWPI